MHGNRSTCFWLIILIVLISGIVRGGNRLYMVRTSDRMVEIRLQLDTPIAGYQLSVSAPDGTTISGFSFGKQFGVGSWLTGSSLKGDTLLTALAMSWSREISLEPGEWSLGSFQFEATTATGDTVVLSFPNALIADQDAHDVGLRTEPLIVHTGAPLSPDGPDGTNFALSSPFPNPFNPSTQVGYLLSKAGDIRITVVDILGREIAVLKDGYELEGTGVVRWDGRDSGGSQAASGMYMIVMSHAGHLKARRIFLQK